LSWVAISTTYSVRGPVPLIAVCVHLLPAEFGFKDPMRVCDDCYRKSQIKVRSLHATTVCSDRSRSALLPCSFLCPGAGGTQPARSERGGPCKGGQIVIWPVPSFAHFSPSTLFFHRLACGTGVTFAESFTFALHVRRDSGFCQFCSHGKLAPIAPSRHLL
jgi:hypothetical protein